ncbi:hypothetical protein LEP1GSC170_1697 [Leptospira interrogans serovar Bataviae str. HAI135]|nr:hypothetical protein LEP1GSC170_1697 [Leptospira interrogans serovar Bataviae str. HAI135]
MSMIESRSFLPSSTIPFCSCSFPGKNPVVSSKKRSEYYKGCKIE